MKKLLVLICLLIVCFSTFNITSVYANETSVEMTQESKPVTNEESIQELEKQITEKINEYKTIAINWIDLLFSVLLGSTGTGAVLIFCLKKISSITKESNNVIGDLKTQKQENENKIENIAKKAENALAMLEEMKDSLLETNKQNYNEVKEVLRLIAVGNTEYVVNGTAEKVDNIVKSGGNYESKEI